MFRLLAQLPTKSQQPIANGLLTVALFASLFGFLTFMGFTETSEEECHGHLWAKKCVDKPIPLSDRITWLALAIGLGVVALICVIAALRLATLRGGLKKYRAILTGIEAIRVQQIADITSASKAKVYRDIQALIDSGDIDDFYIDYQADQVISKRYIPVRSHKTVVTCGRCGANNELIVGITKPCGSCGEPLLLRA